MRTVHTHVRLWHEAGPLILLKSAYRSIP